MYIATSTSSTNAISPTRSFFDEYFKSIRETDDVYSNFNDEYMPAAEDRVLTLSPCFNRNNRQRYIVQAVLVDEMKAVFNPADSAEGN